MDLTKILSGGYSVKVSKIASGLDAGKYLGEVRRDRTGEGGCQICDNPEDAIVMAYQRMVNSDIVSQCREFAGYGMAYQLWDRHNTIAARDVLLKAANTIEELRNRGVE
jgi:hypothetical protein